MTNQTNQRPIDKRQFQQLLADHLEFRDLYRLCQILEITFEDLAGETIVDKAGELIAYAERHSRLRDLLQAAIYLSRHIDWSPVLKGERHALIICTTEYTDKQLSNLNSAYKDAQALKQLLDDPEIGCFDSTSLLLNPSSQEVRHAVQTFFSDAYPPDMMLLYTIGHVIFDEGHEIHSDQFLVMIDTQLDKLRETAVSIDILSEMFKCQSLQIISFRDCTYAYPSDSIRVTNQNLHKSNKILVLEKHSKGSVHGWYRTSLQYAYPEHDPKVTIPFTGMLVRILANGEADLDQDGLITTEEIRYYLFGDKKSPYPKQPLEDGGLPFIARKVRRPVIVDPQLPAEFPDIVQTRMLDAAMAREVVLGIPTELVAQVRLKSSPGLKGILELDIDYDPQPGDVKSRSVQLEFPLDEQKRPQGIFLLLKVTSHDFKPPAQTKKIIVPPDTDSEPCVFQLIPLRPGQLGILLEVYDTGEVVTASTKIRVNCQQDQITATDPENRILISLPLATTVRPFSEIRGEALQKRWKELTEDYKAVMVHIGYESNSASKLRLERQASDISDEIKKIEQQLREDNNLYAQLSQLRVREASGQNVSVKIQQLLAKIEQAENSNQPVENSNQPPTHISTQFDVNIGGNAVGSAIGPNATVNAEIISGRDVQKIQATTNRYENYGSNPGPYDYHSSHAEVIAGNLVEQTASRAFWRAPRTVAVAILMLLPFFAFFYKESILFGIVGLFTITPLCIYVLWQTRFFNIPEFAYKEKKLLVISSWIVTALGVVLIVVIAVMYYIMMLLLTTVTERLERK